MTPRRGSAVDRLMVVGAAVGRIHVLSWDQEAPFQVDLTGRRPAFRIYAEAQKSGRDEVLPMTPDFAQFLAETPEAERVGPVFNLVDQRHAASRSRHRRWARLWPRSARRPAWWSTRPMASLPAPMTSAGLSAPDGPSG